MSAYDRYDLEQLRQELVAAGIAVARISLYIDPSTGDETWQMLDAEAATVVLTAAARAVIAAHVPPAPPPRPDYGGDAADIDRQAADAVLQLRAFIAKTPPTQAEVVANAKLQNRVLLAILRRLAP